jgi:Uncharacterized conserved protein (DUF2303).
MDLTNTTVGTAAIISTVERLAAVDTLPLPVLPGRSDDLSVAVLPEGKKLVDLKTFLDKWRDRPERIQQAVTFGTSDAFIAYVNRFKTPSTTVFVNADPDKPAMMAAIDYHGEAEADGPATTPSFVTHKALHAFPLSDEIKAWMEAMKGGFMGQEAFAYFLQNRERDIENPPVDWMMVDEEMRNNVLAALNLHDDRGPRDEDGNYLMPDPAEYGEDEVSEEPEDTRYLPRSALYKLRKIKFAHAEAMMRLAAGIEVEQSTSVKQAYDPKSGKKTLMYKDDNDTRIDGRRIVVPEMFFVYIPVFDGGQRHLLPVRLYYRIKGNGVVWAVEVVDLRRMIRRAIEAAANTVKAETAVPVYCGMPVPQA